MKIAKTKITPQVFEVIKQVSAALPPMAKYRGGQPVYKTIQILGAKLKSDPRFQNHMLKPGTPFDPKVTYSINVLEYEDHERNLIDGVKKMGVIYIDDYRKAIMAQQTAFMREHAKQNTAIQRIKNVLNNINPWKKPN